MLKYTIVMLQQTQPMMSRPCVSGSRTTNPSGWPPKCLLSPARREEESWDSTVAISDRHLSESSTLR